MPIVLTRAVTRPLKTSETIARKLVHSVVADGLETGDSLPTEAAMLEDYAVSRESLREALRLLEVQGLITIRRGPTGGPSVGAVDPANLGRVSTLYYHMAGATYGELVEAWVLAESILAERAARNRDADARTAAMSPYLVEAPEVASADLDELVLLHTNFHAALAALAGNRVLELSLQTFGSIVSHHFFHKENLRTIGPMVEDDHHRIARAIIAGHARVARELMEEHIEHVARESGFAARFDDYVDWI